MELQPSEFEAYRHGAWSAALRRVDVQSFTATKPPLFFWQVGHDELGAVRSSFNSDVDLAMSDALAELHRHTGGNG